MENFKVLNRSKCLVVSYEGDEIIFNHNDRNGVATVSFKGRCFGMEIPCNYEDWWKAIKELGIDIPSNKASQYMNWLF